MSTNPMSTAPTTSGSTSSAEAAIAATNASVASPTTSAENSSAQALRNRLNKMRRTLFMLVKQTSERRRLQTALQDACCDYTPARAHTTRAIF